MDFTRRIDFRYGDAPPDSIGNRCGERREYGDGIRRHTRSSYSDEDIYSHYENRETDPAAID